MSDILRSENLLTDAQCDAIYSAFDDWCSEVDMYALGVPLDNVKARKLIRVAIATAPTQRKWVGLTEDELSEIYYTVKDLGSDIQYNGVSLVYRFIDLKLREKNT